ncbi:yippee zinc-binding/DNA-binding /Mis18, centromere assembly-domain-containing protein [Sordaria brevicollis]|uniref:Yippee zinc-binding/DNA-binding /Mis18, centromere assembly-domain-containing protein n=1 Tax=Sordaria brevicollis TaxID=83679 RepID=A0AAE0NR81_SORBR|nr:yippee zinc-binding/DNA-binding /Mis18, centromere assembly-domain-containing protein [Sordaria brevicollis]
MVFSLYTTSSSPASADSGPTKPIYLLPSFNLPFRRRRPSITTTLTQTYHHHLDDTSESDSIPSLSSSPDSFTTAFSSSDYAPSSSVPSSNRHSTHLSPIQPDILRCAHCATDIAFASQIISKGFTGRHGRAYLVSPTPQQTSGSHQQQPQSAKGQPTDLPNILTEAPESRRLVTGQHTVADITCAVCSSKLGWKYVDAKEASQKYKVGKFILECARVVTFRSWEDSSSSSPVDTAATEKKRAAGVGKQKQKEPTSSPGEEDQEEGVERQQQQEEPEPATPTTVVFDSDDDSECDDIFAGVWDAETVAKRRKGKVTNMKPRRGGGYWS